MLADGTTLDEPLRSAINLRIRDECSPRPAPDGIRGVPAVPRTLSGKLVEVPVKRILLGKPVDQVVSRDSRANPESLDSFIA